MKGKGTTDAIFMERKMQENFRVKGKKLYFVFVDLQKAFDRVPRKVISWAMRKLGVEEWLVSAVMSMYTGAKTVVRTVYGNSKGFEVKVGMRQGSGLSPLLFVIVMEAISREFRVALPWELMPLPLTISCFSKIQIGYTFLVPAHPGSPGSRFVKRVCVSLIVPCTTASLYPKRHLDHFSRFCRANS